MLFKASAPGSLMLLGEHAVLHNHPALVCAVKQRMHVQIAPRHDDKISIISSLGRLEISLSQLQMQIPFQFVTAVLMHFREYLAVGCDITIESEFSDKVGFASSAAVTVAMIKALDLWLSLSLSDSDLIQQARTVVQTVQGLGSGADVAACVLGGIVAYQMQPLRAERLPSLYPIVAVYSGYKTPTVEVVKTVQALAQQNPDLVSSTLQAIGLCAESGITCAAQQDWEGLGRVMTMQHDLMQALGVSTPLLNEIVNQLQVNGVLGAKISGSGLGDCVVGLGVSLPLHFSSQANVQEIPVSMSAQGVLGEKI